MSLMKTICLSCAVVLLAVGLIMSQDKPVTTVKVTTPAVSMKLAGPGAMDAKTIKAGQPVSLILSMSNDQERRGFSMGFKFTSKDIKNIVHVADTVNGINKTGDVIGHNGWQDKSIWDLGGVYVAEKNWDGVLPDTLGFGGVCVKKAYQPHAMMETLEIKMIVPTPGSFTVDTSFFPPGGFWKYDNGDKATWDGPYTFKVVK